MSLSSPVRPGLPSLALLSILVISAAWWALALWPAGAVEPEWLVRTRAVCFGSMRGGLPDAGGWIVLIGEPIGMLGVLLAVWGRALADDLRRLRAHAGWRALLLVVSLTTTFGLLTTVQHVAFVSGLGQALPNTQSGVLTTADIDVTSLELLDQRGIRGSIADPFGRSSILTFAFGHCATVCPTVVHDVRIARLTANRADVPIVVITLDPWRDTPEHLPMIASQWELGPEDRLLSGSVEEVERVLDVLRIRRRRDERTGEVEHTNVIMVTDGRGHVVQRLDGWWGRTGELFEALPSPTPISDAPRSRRMP